MSEAQKIPGSEILGATVRADQEYRVKVYDFKRPDKFSAEQIRTMRFIHESIARRAAPTISQIVGRSVEVRAPSVDQLAFYEFFDSIPAVRAFIPVSMSPLKGPMLMEIDGDLARALIHTACGSAPEASTSEAELSEMECLVIRDIVDRLTPLIDEGWNRIIGLSTSSLSVETDPQFAQIVPPTEMIILGILEVTVGDISGFINMAIPYLTIEPIVSRLGAMYWYSSVRRGPAPVVAERVAQVPVDVELISEADPIPVSSLPAILAGEPVELPDLSDNRVHICAGGVRVAEGSAAPDALVAPEPITVRVVSHRVSESDGLLSTEERASVPLLLSNAVESLTHHIKDVKRSVAELRDDRNTLVDLDPRDDDAVGPDIAHRHHKDVALLLHNEPPAIAGFVLAGMSPDLAAVVLADLDPDVQPHVVRAIEALRDGERRLQHKLITHVARRISRTAQTNTTGGAQAVVDILNLVPRSLEKRVMEGFIETDKPLFERIARLMFVFEDFVLVDPTAIQKVFARVSVEEIALAMKGVEQEVAAHILGAIDPDDADELSRRIGELGPVRRSAVETAQRDLIEELRQLEEAGEVVIARPEEVVE